MMIIELPEGGWVDVECITAVVMGEPENEFAEAPSGCVILTTSGHAIPTAETPDQVLLQMTECMRVARELEEGGDE